MHHFRRTLALLLAGVCTVSLLRAAAEKAAAVKPAATVNATLATKALTKEKLVANKRFVLEGWQGKLADTKITDLAGNDVAATLAPRSEGAGVTLAVATVPFLMKPRAVQTMAFSSEKETVLPGGMVRPPPAKPEAGGRTKSVWYQLTCSASPRPAPWNDAAREYVTTLRFTVKSSDGSPDAVDLPHPITVALEFDGLIAADVPPFTLEQAGLAHQKQIELRFKPSGAQPKLKIRSTVSDTDLFVEALPRLELRPARTTLLGFGLETIEIAVARVLASGEPAKLGEASPVDVQVRGSARREGGDVAIPAGEARTAFTLRSSGLGKVGVSATAGALTDSVEVLQRFPTGPLLAALLGGALGGFSRRWVKGAKPRAAWRNPAEGLVVGLVAFVAAVLGVGYLDLPPAIAATEAGAFLTGVLCGFAGVTLFGAMTQKLAPKKTE